MANQVVVAASPHQKRKREITGCGRLEWHGQRPHSLKSQHVRNTIRWTVNTSRIGREQSSTLLRRAAAGPHFERMDASDSRSGSTSGYHHTATSSRQGKTNVLAEPVGQLGGSQTNVAAGAAADLPWNGNTPSSTWSQPTAKLQFELQVYIMRRFTLTRQMCCVRGCSAMRSRNNRRGQARLRADHRALHPTSTPSVPAGRDSAQPSMFVNPTVRGMERANQYPGNISCILKSVSPMDSVPSSIDALGQRRSRRDQNCYAASFKTGTLTEYNVKRFLKGKPKAHKSTGTWRTARFSA